MELGKTHHATTRKEWRKWLLKHHATEPEIWLVTYKKHTAKPTIPYDEAVEEALCFGWIDSTVKTIDADSYAQRYSPRKKGSKWSEMNKERIRRLIKNNKMSPAGIAAADSVLKELAAEDGTAHESNTVAADILAALKENEAAWKHFREFPDSYKRIRIGWIEGARKRPAVFEQRLRYFVNMSAKNKQFGMVR